MVSAVDSSVLLDVLCADPKHADSSAGLLRKAWREGRVIVSECVLAEVRPALGKADLLSWMKDWRLELAPGNMEVALLAGEMFSRYLERGGKSGRIVPDFLIGAHARLLADRLLARDRGFWRDYFNDLPVLSE